MDSTTLRDWNDAGQPAGYYLGTYCGFTEVTRIDSDWWVHCPSDHIRFDLSFCCHPNTPLYTEAVIVETFGNMTKANEMIRVAGGHIQEALKIVDPKEA